MGGLVAAFMAERIVVAMDVRHAHFPLHLWERVVRAERGPGEESCVSVAR